MSDHWNSIANLLKTPSLGPTTKKSDGPAKPSKAALPTETSKPVEPVTPPVEAKAKPETSRLRSSWDAVATFFGVATPEQSSEKETPSASTPAALESNSQAKSSVSGGRRAKPSMWGDPVEPAARSEEPAAPARVADIVETRESEPPRRGNESSDRGRSRDRGRAPREDRAPRAESSDVHSAPVRDEEVGTTSMPERRSQRHQPRRGRQADVRAESGFAAPIEADEVDPIDVIPSFDADLPPRSDIERTPRGRGPRGGDERTPRGERPPRPDRGPRTEKTERPRPVRDDGFEVAEGFERPERKPRSDVAARSERPESVSRPARSDADRSARPERAERPPRPERGERAPRAEGAERSERGHRGDRPERPARADSPRADGQERAAGSRERSPRHDRNSPRGERGADRVVREETLERRPSTSASKKSSGFGAGIHDDDSFGFVDDAPEIEHEFEPVDDLIDDGIDMEVVRENVEREGRPRRRRGRGRRSESRGAGSDADGPARDVVDDRDVEDDDSSEFISRNSRIPSWQDTIGTLVAVNMENHQKNQSGGRAPRGRGPRRDR